MGGKAALIIVIGFAMILGYVAMNLSETATMAIGNMSMYNNATASHNLASAGANAGLAKFYQDTSWRGPLSQSFSSGPFRGSFHVRVTDLPGEKAVLRSVSTFPLSPFRSLHDTIEVYFDRNKYNSFSVFAWMTNFEGNVFWITGDSVWGRVHSNGNLHVNGRPVFFEKATTSKGFNPKPGTGTNKAIFKQGYETGIAQIDFPTNLNELINASTSGGRRYPGSIWVTLDASTAANNDGIALIRATQSGPIIDTIRLNSAGFNGALVADGRVNIQGTVDGRLSVGSLSDVFIQDNVVYERNPLQTSSDDMLGLVAENNVVVANNAANNSNCEVHASIFCRTGSFMAENYNSRPVSGELRVLGSIVQDTRGAVGTFSGSTLNSGFSKRYRYDPRLADPANRPPFYPGFYVKTFAITNWWESYRLPSVN